jgi:hypothetical protein
MRGEVKQAVEHFLDYELAEPLSQDLHRVNRPFYTTLAPVYEDPRVAARLAEDAKRYEELRREVRAMLQRPEWGNP